MDVVRCPTALNQLFAARLVVAGRRRHPGAYRGVVVLISVQRIRPAVLSCRPQVLFGRYRGKLQLAAVAVNGRSVQVANKGSLQNDLLRIYCS
jgi:hypothetical protein